MTDKKKIKPSLRNLASGDVLFREGEVGDFAYQVVKGKIEVTKFNGDEYVTLALLEKGALFGEMALIDKQPRSAMARAVNEATVREIDKDALLGYLKNSPQTAFNMMQQLASYARNANEKLSVDAFSNEENNTSDDIEEESEENKEKRKKKLILNELLDEFDDDMDRLKSKVLPKSVKYSVFSFGFLVLFLIIWGSISEIDTTISATGKITTVVPNVEVQSNYNSVVKKIFVKKGQEVGKGEPLVAFDSTLQRADMKKLNYQLSVINSKIDRLKKQSELRSNSSVSNPADDRQKKYSKIKRVNTWPKWLRLINRFHQLKTTLLLLKNNLIFKKN